jgi:rare lipoprotein A
VEVAVLDVAGVDDRRDATFGKYRFLQLGAFGSEDTAHQLQGELQDILPVPVFISPVQAGESLLYRVRVGPVTDNDQLLAVQEQLEQSGYSSGQPLP